MSLRDHPEWVGRPVVRFSDSVTTFFFLDGVEEAPVMRRETTSRTKLFDGRSDAQRSQIDWSEIEDFLIKSSTKTIDEECSKRIGRDRCYAQEWFLGEKEEEVQSESTNDDYDDDEYAQMIMMMEHFPCDADLWKTFHLCTGGYLSGKWYVWVRFLSANTPIHIIQQRSEYVDDINL